MIPWRDVVLVASGLLVGEVSRIGVVALVRSLASRVRIWRGRELIARLGVPASRDGWRPYWRLPEGLMVFRRGLYEVREDGVVDVLGGADLYVRESHHTGQAGRDLFEEIWRGGCWTTTSP